MSHFLLNLIARHQQNSVSRGALPVVQPRPKAKFESHSRSDAIQRDEVGISDDLVQTISSSETDSTAVASEQKSPRAQLPTEPGIDKTAIHTNPEHRIDDLVERIETLTILQPGQKSPAEQRPIGAPEHQSELSETATQRNSRGLPLTGDLNQPVQTRQPRLKDQQSLRTDDQGPVESPLHTPIANTGNNIRSEAEHLSPMLETTLGVTHLAFRAKKPELETLSAHQSGSLQIPSWVDQLQAYNTNRWRGINSRPEPETVVNVTIGRVEVRAVQADVAKPVKSRNRASGVMSLDDYLMQCDKERV